MNRQLRYLAIGLVVCYVALFTQLNRIQVFQAAQYNDKPDNDREVIRDFNRDRGRIVTSDGVVVAESVPSQDRFEYQRVYPQGDLFAHTTGYFSLGYGSTQVERTQNDVLAGRTAQQRLSGFGDLFEDSVNVGDVTLTLRKDIQEVAKQALGDREGSVVAMDPRTGAIIAMWSWPSYDPNLVATHDFDAATEARELLVLDPKKPLLANAYQERYMPGSTFKVITTAVGLLTGALTPETFTEPSRSYTPPGTTNPIFNYGGTVCGGFLLEAFYRSCNTTFAKAAVDAGAQAMVDGTEAFGFNQDVPIDLPDPAQSYYPPVSAFEFDTPKLAQTGFGQNDVATTPLQMAMTAAAIANNGVIMQPYVVAETRDRQGTLLSKTTPRAWKTATTPEIAAWIRGAMVEVVNQGTARCCMQLANGEQAAAKTGTAQLNPPGEPPASHAWITSFAPAAAPRVVVTVMVKASDEVTAGTGGTVAGPIARQVLDAVLATPDPLAPAVPAATPAPAPSSTAQPGG